MKKRLHTLRVLADSGDEDSPGSAWLAGDNSGDRIYTLNEQSLDANSAPSNKTGGDEEGNTAPHNNMPPYLALKHIIYTGIA